FRSLYVDLPTTLLYSLSLHDALPISKQTPVRVETSSKSSRVSLNVRPSDTASSSSQFRSLPYSWCSWLISWCRTANTNSWNSTRSEEHTSELQSRFVLVCRLLLEIKK